jgi:hypothetical protein
MLATHVILFYCADYFILKIGTSKRRTRGKSLMRKIHARTMEEREEKIFNEESAYWANCKSSIWIQPFLRNVG